MAQTGATSLGLTERDHGEIIQTRVEVYPMDLRIRNSPVSQARNAGTGEIDGSVGGLRNQIF